MTKTGQIKGTWVSDRDQMKVNLSLISFEEDGSQIIYCPALDISGYGITEVEAMESFKVCLGEFFLYTTRKGTFSVELKRMGWIFRNSKRKSMLPPPMSKLLEENENFSRIFNDHSFKKFDTAVELPLAS